MEQIPQGSSERTRLERFTRNVEQDDTEMIDYWRNASSSEHALAMSQLSDYAEKLSAQTGLGKDPAEMFPGFPKKNNPTKV